jgi:hypothetical protein
MGNEDKIDPLIRRIKKALIRLLPPNDTIGIGKPDAFINSTLSHKYIYSEVPDNILYELYLSLPTGKTVADITLVEALNNDAVLQQAERTVLLLEKSASWEVFLDYWKQVRELSDKQSVNFEDVLRKVLGK